MKPTRVILSTCAVVSSVVCISAYSVASSEPSVSFSVAKPYTKETALKPKVEILEPLGPLHDISEPDILEAFKSRVGAMKVSGEYDRRFNQTKAMELVEDDNGRIIGIKAASKGNEFFIRARKGVILAAGGFGANLMTVEAFDPRLKGLPSNCSSGSTGDMLFAARRIGASVVDLNEIQCLPGPFSNKGIRVRFHNDVRRFVFVNDEGKRFVDERARRDELKEKILVQKNKSCYCIIDNDGLETLDLLVRRDAIRAAETGDAVKAQSLEELASALNIPTEALIKTIEERNAEIASDKPQSRRFPIRKAPFWAARVGMRIHYTMGGLQINEKAQCLKDGKPIPGLFAAGEITGGIHGRNRIGGNGLADAFTFGMIAAENLVSES